MGEFWFVTGIDDVLSKLPAEWLDLGLASGAGAHANDGLRFESGANGVSLRVGSVCRQLFDVYHRTVATAVNELEATDPLEWRACNRQRSISASRTPSPSTLESSHRAKRSRLSHRGSASRDDGARHPLTVDWAGLRPQQDKRALPVIVRR